MLEYAILQFSFAGSRLRRLFPVLEPQIFSLSVLLELLLGPEEHGRPFFFFV
jgi:hypothetical protein